VFIVRGGVLTSLIFMFTREEVASSSRLFSVVLISLRILLGITYLKSPGQIRFYLLYYNPLIHNVLVRAVQRMVYLTRSMEFRLIESPFLNSESLGKLGGWMKKKYGLMSYFFILSICRFLLLR